MSFIEVSDFYSVNLDLLTTLERYMLVVNKSRVRIVYIQRELCSPATSMFP